MYVFSLAVFIPIFPFHLIHHFSYQNRRSRLKRCIFHNETYANYLKQLMHSMLVCFDKTIEFLIFSLTSKNMFRINTRNTKSHHQTLLIHNSLNALIYVTAHDTNISRLCIACNVTQTNTNVSLQIQWPAHY